MATASGSGAARGSAGGVGLAGFAISPDPLRTRIPPPRRCTTPSCARLRRCSRRRQDPAAGEGGPRRRARHAGHLAIRGLCGRSPHSVGSRTEGFASAGVFWASGPDLAKGRAAGSCAHLVRWERRAEPSSPRALERTGKS